MYENIKKFILIIIPLIFSANKKTGTLYIFKKSGNHTHLLISMPAVSFIKIYTRKCGSTTNLLTFVGVWMQPSFSNLITTSLMVASDLNILYSVFFVANLGFFIVGAQGSNFAFCVMVIFMKKD